MGLQKRSFLPIFLESLNSKSPKILSSGIIPNILIGIFSFFLGGGVVSVYVFSQELLSDSVIRVGFL